MAPSSAPLPDRPAAPRQYRIDRRWGRVLLVGAVVTAVAVPTTDALAAGRHAPKPRPAAGRHAVAPKPPKAAKPKPDKPAKPAVDPAVTAPDPVAGGGDTGVEPLRRTGEDVRWWPWGPVVSGRLTRPVKGGYQTLVLQRGEITAIGAGTVTVTSADGVVTVWTVTDRTKVPGPPVPRPRPRTRETDPTSTAPTSTEPTSTEPTSTEPTSSEPTSTTPSTPPRPGPMSRLALHQRVGVWGTASGDTVTATFVIVRGTVPPAGPGSSTPPTPTDTSAPPSPTDSTAPSSPVE
jgi:hypothetical protein